MAIEDPEIVSRIERLLLAVFSSARDRTDNYDVTYAFAVGMGRYQWNEGAVWFEGSPKWDPAPTPPRTAPIRIVLGNTDEASGLRAEALIRFDDGPELVPGFTGSQAEFDSRINRLLLVWFPTNAQKRDGNFDVTSLFAVDLSRYYWQAMSMFFDSDANSIEEGRAQVFALEKDGEAHATRSEAVIRFKTGPELRG